MNIYRYTFEYVSANGNLISRSSVTEAASEDQARTNASAAIKARYKYARLINVKPFDNA